MDLRETILGEQRYCENQHNILINETKKLISILTVMENTVYSINRQKSSIKIEIPFALIYLVYHRLCEKFKEIPSYISQLEKLITLSLSIKISIYNPDPILSDETYLNLIKLKSSIEKEISNIYRDLLIFFKQIIIDQKQKVTIQLESANYEVNDDFSNKFKSVDFENLYNFENKISKFSTYYLSKKDICFLLEKINYSTSVKTYRNEKPIKIIIDHIQRLSPDDKISLFYPSNTNKGKKGYKSQITNTIKDSNDKSLFEKTYNKEWDQNFFNSCWNKAREISKDLYEKQH
jgi:hypothetical protein